MKRIKFTRKTVPEREAATPQRRRWCSLVGPTSAVFSEGFSNPALISFCSPKHVYRQDPQRWRAINGGEEGRMGARTVSNAALCEAFRDSTIPRTTGPPQGAKEQTKRTHA